MRTKEVCRRLRLLGAAIEELTDGDANLGGCCIIAATVSARLSAYGIRVEVQSCDYGESAKALRPNYPPHEWRDNGMSGNHFVTRFRIGRRVYTWDSDVLTDRACMGGWDSGCHRFGTGMTHDEAEALYWGTSWNSAFNMDHIPDIRMLAQLYFPQH